MDSDNGSVPICDYLWFEAEGKVLTLRDSRGHDLLVTDVALGDESPSANPTRETNSNK